jgi:hypothetical protein
MQRFYYLILLLSTSFLSNTIIAQDITGLWKGTIYNDSTQKYLRYEVGISDDGKGKLTGFSHTWFLIEDKEYFGVKELKIKQSKNGNIIIEDDGLISNNYTIAPSKGVKQTSVLQLDASGSIMELKGTFSTNRTKVFSALTGQVFLQRKNDFMQSALVAHLQEMGLTEKLPFLATTKTINEAVVATTVIEEKIAIPTITASKETTSDVVETKAKVNTPPAEEKKTNTIAQNTDDKKVIAIKNEPIKSPTSNTEKKTNTTIATVKPTVQSTPKPVVKSTPIPAESKDKTSIAANTEIKKEATIKPTNPIAEVETKKPIEKIEPVAPRITVARKVETIQTLTFKTDSLVLTLYDNGVVDGDTVSVIMNGRLIMNHIGLSTNAIKKTIYTKDIKEDSIQLIMYAETLGSIAPNTGLLIVYDGNDRYEIRFSGDLQKNAAILFKRKKY